MNQPDQKILLDLPQEILLCIMGNLGISSLNALAMSNRFLELITADHTLKVRGRVTKAQDLGSPGAIDYLDKNETELVLEFAECPKDTVERLLSYIGELGRMQYHLNPGIVDGTGHRMRNLQELSLHNCTILLDQVNLSQFPPSLREVELVACKIVDAHDSLNECLATGQILDVFLEDWSVMPHLTLILMKDCINLFGKHYPRYLAGHTLQFTPGTSFTEAVDIDGVCWTEKTLDGGVVVAHGIHRSLRYEDATVTEIEMLRAQHPPPRLEMRHSRGESTAPPPTPSLNFEFFLWFTALAVFYKVASFLLSA